jgi:hypothetical protein
MIYSTRKVFIEHRGERLTIPRTKLINRPLNHEIECPL